MGPSMSVSFSPIGPWPLVVVLLVLALATVLPFRFVYPNLAPRPWRGPLLAGAAISPCLVRSASSQIFFTLPPGRLDLAELCEAADESRISECSTSAAVIRRCTGWPTARVRPEVPILGLTARFGTAGRLFLVDQKDICYASIEDGVITVVTVQLEGQEHPYRKVVMLL